jgi:hypothetical protein
MPAPASQLMQAAPSALYPIGAAICMTLGLTPNSKIPTRFRFSEEKQWIALFVGCLILVKYLRDLKKHFEKLEERILLLQEERDGLRKILDDEINKHTNKQAEQPPRTQTCRSE